MNAPASSHADHPHDHAAGHTGGHSINLMACFLALLALTAGEVLLFEVWVHTHFVPKFVMVLMLLILTLPKAAIVMIYFMHLKFEKHLLVLLAVVPLLMIFVAVLPTLTDIMTLKHNDLTRNQVHGLADWNPMNAGHSAQDHGGEHDHSPTRADESAPAGH